MFLLLSFAFLAGIVTILSPCILPILPVVLSGSVGSGRKRPIGIITGFVLSFTVVTLFLSVIVQLSGISADVLRNLSVIIILLFGISLLIPKTQVLLEQLFSKLAGKVPQSRERTGFWGGVMIGLSLGLVWTPCVGPIIASVITLAATNSVNAAAFFITFAYALGTAIPMFAVMTGGRTLLQKHPRLLRHSGSIQRIFGVLMILTALMIFFQIDRRFQVYILDTFPKYGAGLTKLEDNEAVIQQLELLGSGNSMHLMNRNTPSAPDIIPGGEWYNLSDGRTGLSLNELRGKVVLIDFWTYTCINCIRTLPYLRDWHQKYADKGLVIIGVHTPEFEFEKNPDNVGRAIHDFGLRYPIVQDNEYATWRAYQNRYWPAKYFIDKDGKIRSAHFGEGAYDETEELIQELLRELGSDVSAIPIENPQYFVETGTPELYLGYGRIEYLVSPERILPDQKMTYSTPTMLPVSRFAYNGAWMIGREYAEAAKNAELMLHYDAKDVFLVMRSVDGKPSRVRVMLDGQQVPDTNDVTNSVVTVTTDRLYEVIKGSIRGTHRLQLIFPDGNIEVYAFTFG